MINRKLTDYSQDGAETFETVMNKSKITPLTTGNTSNSAPTGKSGNIADDIAALEASLHIDIEAFDLELAEVSRTPSSIRAFTAPTMPKPVIKTPAKPAAAAPVTPSPAPAAPTPAAAGGASLLETLRLQAETRQREESQAQAKRTEMHAAIDQGLKRSFSYLHDLSEQLNILKPTIARDYQILENFSLSNLVWHEGFSDYRSQSQSAKAMIEQVSLSYQLKGDKPLIMMRDGLNIERTRNMLFDFGLSFSCEEFKNERRVVDKAEFTIRNELNISARWLADYDRGEVVLETRNLDRLGTVRFNVPPERITQSLLDAFGHMLLGQPNNFRELLRRG